jgi:GntR family carbon starvation induced transcriptional regulator
VAGRSTLAKSAEDPGSGGANGARTRSTDTYWRLRQDILECRLPPGARLRAEELCEMYGVGISPLREALSRLSSEGLTVLKEHRGYQVAPVSREDLVDLTRTRIMIESAALSASIANGDDEWESRVVAEFHRLSKTEAFVAGSRILGSEWELRHSTFHRTLLEACGSPWLLSLRDMLYAHGDRYRRLSVQVQAPVKPRAANVEHREIFEAVIGRDAPRACLLLAQHIQRTTDALLENGSGLFDEAAATGPT